MERERQIMGGEINLEQKIVSLESFLMEQVSKAGKLTQEEKGIRLKMIGDADTVEALLKLSKRWNYSFLVIK